MCYKRWWQFARLRRACIPTSISSCQSGESNDTIISMQILLPTSQLAISTQCQVILPPGKRERGNIGVQAGYRGSKSFSIHHDRSRHKRRMRSTKMSRDLVKTPKIRRREAKCADNSLRNKFVASFSRQWRKQNKGKAKIRLLFSLFLPFAVL